MNFMFEWQEQYNCSFSYIQYCSFSYKDILMTAFLTIFRRFPKISEDFSKLFWRPDERSRTFSETFRRLPKTSEEDPKMFRWYTNEFKFNFRGKLDSSEIIDIFTWEDIISSHMRISYCFYQIVTIRYTTDFYITINLIQWFLFYIRDFIWIITLTEKSKFEENCRSEGIL